MKKKAKIRALRGDHFVIALSAGGDLYKLFRILFTQDGSIAVTFPDMPKVPGIVSLCTFPANAIGPINISLEENGAVTSHMVKYSHHWSGVAHFSQTGKVLTKIRNHARPLTSYAGNIFNVRVQGIEELARTPVREEDAWTPKEEYLRRRVIPMSWRDKTPVALKVVANCYCKPRFRERFIGNEVGPVTSIKDITTGRVQTGWVLSAKLSSKAASTFIVLTAEAIPPITDQPGAHVSFVGGFDDATRDMSKDSHFLALNYPASEPEKLLDSIGTIDLI